MYISTPNATNKQKLKERPCGHSSLELDLALHCADRIIICGDYNGTHLSKYRSARTLSERDIEFISHLEDKELTPVITDNYESTWQRRKQKGRKRKTANGLEAEAVGAGLAPRPLKPSIAVVWRAGVLGMCSASGVLGLWSCGLKQTLNDKQL